MKTNKEMKTFLTPKQQDILTSIAHSRTRGAALVLRSSILLAYKNTSNQSEVVRSLKSSWDIVHRWVHRWHKHAQELRVMEDTLEHGQYEAEIIRVLSDEARPGAPARITESQKQQIIAMATRPPSDYGIPMTQWSCETLAMAVIDQGIVDTISASHVYRFLKSGHAQAA